MAIFVQVTNNRIVSSDQIVGIVFAPATNIITVSFSDGSTLTVNDDSTRTKWEYFKQILQITLSLI